MHYLIFSVGVTPHITLLQGNYCQLEPLSVAKHLDDLSDFYLEANAVMPDWTYLSIAPAKNKEELHALLTKQEASTDPYFLTIVDKQTRKAVGALALMRIDPKNRVIEVGWVNYSPALQRTRMATEVQYLLAKYVFETLQYRRYEWKCDSLNDLRAVLQSAWALYMRAHSGKQWFTKVVRETPLGLL